MPNPRFWLLASTFVLCAAAPVSRVSVIDYDFATPPPAAMLDPRLFGDQATAHGFTRGWHEMEENGVWMLGPEAVFDFVAEGSACEIQVEVATNEAVASKGQRLELQLNGQRLAEFSVGDWSQARTETCAVPDPALRQGWNRLRFVAAAVNDVTIPSERKQEPPYAVFLRRLAIRLSSTAVQQERMRTRYAGSDDAPPWRWTFIPEGGAAPAERPDVLILLLDAARRDHFGCYGYPRDTTPFIDSLAADGLKFEQVFTEIPFTRGAVPGLLTGYSWVHHRVTGRTSALGSSLSTLAECFAAAGYHTLGASHNPNASVAAGTDRGFEEFVEVWKLPGPRKRGMEAPARFLLERLEAGLPDQPVFCYLHVVPPHTPYRPRPEDDLWSDPLYAGIVKNGSGDVTLLDRGLLPWDETDRQHVVDLYDGNLRRGDALVESVVTAWKQARPGRELFTVIVSDHGEAFAEHGRFLHSTTLYDEMTAIPLIMHPASRCASLAASTPKLRSIVDVMPMLLQTLGIAWRGASYVPEAFARLLEDPAWERPYVTLRANTMFGVRTARHLAFFDRWGERGLFELSTDPSATMNRADEEPGLFLRFAGWMRQTEQEVPVSSVEPEDVPVLDLEALKALGYVDP